MKLCKEIFDDQILTIVNEKLSKKEDNNDLDLVPEAEIKLVKEIERYLINRFPNLLKDVTNEEFNCFDNLTIRRFLDNTNVKFYGSKFLINKRCLNRDIGDITPVPIIFAFHIRPVNKFHQDINIRLELTNLEPVSILLSGFREVELLHYDEIYSKKFFPGWKKPEVFFSAPLFFNISSWINLVLKRTERTSISKYVNFGKDILEAQDFKIKELLAEMWEEYEDIEDNKGTREVCPETIIYNNRA